MARFSRGTTFLDRYVLLGPVGHGGVSVVYRAFDTVNRRHVAIKMLGETLPGDTRARQRIRREAIITDRVRHPSVPKVYSYGDAPQRDGTSVAYVVMELLEGTVLAGHLAEGALPWLDAVRVAAAIADVLAVAHRRGVVHRDLTAANVMATEDGIHIIDFGVAVTVQTPEDGGGPFVLPPAPLANDFAGPGEPADDVYALGVLLYEMLAGRPPSDNLPPPTATAAMRLPAPTPMLDVLTAPGVPRALVEICRRCLAKRPADRPGAARVALDLWALIVPAAPALTRPTGAHRVIPLARTPQSWQRPADDRTADDRFLSPWQRPPHSEAPPGRTPHGEVPHGETPHGEVPHGEARHAVAEPEPVPGDVVRPARRSRPAWAGRSGVHRTVDLARRRTAPG